MTFRIVYKPLAQVEAAEALAWYDRPEIGMGDHFLADLERTNNFVAENPWLYPCVEAEIRRANLMRFPYSLFYVIDGGTINILSCFHQHRDPISRK